jgi:hypothetical protein
MAKTSKKAKKSGAKKLPKAKIQMSTRELKAAAIVGQVLVHFGAGYGAQRESENPTAPLPNSPIFTKPTDLARFHHKLLESTFRNLSIINWGTNTPLRDQITKAAFHHGVLARQRVVADGTTTLSYMQIIETLKTVQANFCPGSGGAGGGPVCDF